MKKELEEILRDAGQIMLGAQSIENSVQEKEGSANFVTQYDVAVQQLLRRRLLELRPNAQFIGEEEDCHADLLQKEAFIVDPIDGTTNFIKHYDSSAVSVAFAYGGKVVVGAVYNPYRDEFFYAEIGQGAFCNDVPIHVQDLPLSQSLVCFGTSPYYSELTHPTFVLAESLLNHALDLRRSGSAAIDLCDVARGRAGLMFELVLSPWDYAAASLIVTEAGGCIGQLDGSPVTLEHPCGVVAGAPKAWDDFFALQNNS